jgi:6-phosphogluconolactonase
MIYRLDLENGYLIPATSQSLHLEAGSGPRHLEFHPRGKFAYVIQELNSTVSVLAFDPVSGAFEILQTISSLPADYQGESYAAAIHVSPNGKFLYASNRGHDSLALFVIDDDTGTLTCMGHQPTGGTTPRDFGIDPSGKYLLAANQNSDTVVTFRIHPQTGFLEETGEVAKVPTPVCVKII